MYTAEKNLQDLLTSLIKELYMRFEKKKIYLIQLYI